MRNEFYRHKKSDKIKWIITGIAFLLVFLMLVGICLQLFGIGKVKPSEWFKNSDTEQTVPDNYNVTSKNSSSGLIVVPNKSENQKISLVSAPVATIASSTNKNYVTRNSSLADSVSITATVEPDYVRDKSVTWSMAWKDGSSAWANGKTVTDYVVLSSTTNLTITVSSKTAFGEPIILTVTANSNTDITNSVTIYYEKRYEAINLVLGGGYSITENDCDILFTSTDSTTTIMEFNNLSSHLAYRLSDGTTNTFDSVSAKIRFSNTQYLKDMCSALDSVQGGLSYDGLMGAEYDSSDFVLTEKTLWHYFLTIGGKSSYSVMINQQYPRFKNAAMRCLQDYTDQIIAEIIITVSTDYSTYSKSFGFGYSSTSLAFVAEGVNISQSSITF